MLHHDMPGAVMSAIGLPAVAPAKRKRGATGSACAPLVPVQQEGVPILAADQQRRKPTKRRRNQPAPSESITHPCILEEESPQASGQLPPFRPLFRKSAASNEPAPEAVSSDELVNLAPGVAVIPTTLRLVDDDDDGYGSGCGSLFFGQVAKGIRQNFPGVVDVGVDDEIQRFLDSHEVPVAAAASSAGFFAQNQGGLVPPFGAPVTPLPGMDFSWLDEP